MRTPLVLLDRYGYCPFCLAIKNSTSRVICQMTYGIVTPGTEVTITNPIELIKWLDEKIREKYFISFELDATSFAFIPVALVRDTPLCPVHLWTLTELEMHRYSIRLR